MSYADYLIFSGQDIGVFSHVLPFMIIFAVVFALLEKSSLLGKKDEVKKINLIVSLGIGLLAIQTRFVSDFFSVIFSNFAIGISIFLVLLLLDGLFYFNSGEKQKTVFMWIGIIIMVGIALWTFTSMGFWFNSNFFYNLLYNNFWTLVVLGLIILVIWFVLKSKEE
jgi:hypothetical protein